MKHFLRYWRSFSFLPELRRPAEEKYTFEASEVETEAVSRRRLRRIPAQPVRLGQERFPLQAQPLRQERGRHDHAIQREALDRREHPEGDRRLLSPDEHGLHAVRSRHRNEPNQTLPGVPFPQAVFVPYDRCREKRRRNGAKAMRGTLRPLSTGRKTRTIPSLPSRATRYCRRTISRAFPPAVEDLLLHAGAAACQRGHKRRFRPDGSSQCGGEGLLSPLRHGHRLYGPERGEQDDPVRLRFLTEYRHQPRGARGIRPDQRLQEDARRPERKYHLERLQRGQLSCWACAT